MASCWGAWKLMGLHFGYFRFESLFESDGVVDVFWMFWISSIAGGDFGIATKQLVFGMLGSCVLPNRSNSLHGPAGRPLRWPRRRGTTKAWCWRRPKQSQSPRWRRPEQNWGNRMESLFLMLSRGEFYRGRPSQTRLTKSRKGKLTQRPQAGSWCVSAVRSITAQAKQAGRDWEQRHPHSTIRSMTQAKWLQRVLHQ